MLIDHDFPQELPSLTERQAQVLACLGNHMTTKEIARALDISPSMVDQHLRAVSKKLGGLPRREMARWRSDRRERLVAYAAPLSPVNEQPSSPPLQRWYRLRGEGGFITGFLTGLVCGILIVCATMLSVTLFL